MKMYKVRIRYTDGTAETLILRGKNPDEAEVEAEGWLDYRKIVEDITAVSEVPRRPQLQV